MIMSAAGRFLRASQKGTCEVCLRCLRNIKRYLGFWPVGGDCKTLFGCTEQNANKKS